MILALLVCFALSLATTAMIVSLKSMSLPYLRYWARKGDATAKNIYPLKSRGSAVYLTIELIRAVAVSGTFVSLYSIFGAPLGFAVGVIILFVVFIVVGELYLRPVGSWLLARLSSILIKGVYFIRPITLWLGSIFDRFIEDAEPSITKAELDLLISSAKDSDTDLSADEIKIIQHTLTFGNKIVHDVMTPRSVFNYVNTEDQIGPVLLDELYKTGHSRFPVFTEGGQSVVGTLFIKDLVDLKSKATVSEKMHKAVFYVNEERELNHVLQAFIRTKHHLFIVVNEFAEITGLITIEDIIEQILGKQIIDEFDKYDDMREVAAQKAKRVKKQMKSIN